VIRCTRLLGSAKVLIRGCIIQRCIRQKLNVEPSTSVSLLSLWESLFFSSDGIRSG
jgi:hypothetical protein